MKAFIVGSGSFLPERIVSNEEIAGSLGLEPEWIHKASGIRRRRWATKGTTTSSLAVRALGAAMAGADTLRLTCANISELPRGGP